MNLTPEKAEHARRILENAKRVETETDRGCRSIFGLFQRADIKAAAQEKQNECRR